MKMITKQIASKMPKLYESEVLGMDAVAYVRYFSLKGDWEWYGTEFDGTDRFYGLVNGFEPEFGYFSLSELSKVVVKELGGIPAIERDLYFEPTPIKEILERVKR